MIAPQQLRLGNWININGSPFQLELPDFNLIANNNGKSTYEPIELTEEWLLKFSFKNTETGYELIFGYQHRFSVILFKKFASVGISGPFGLIHVKIKYVHQLQNLYFSLIGKELTIKE